MRCIWFAPEGAGGGSFSDTIVLATGTEDGRHRLGASPGRGRVAGGGQRVRQRFGEWFRKWQRVREWQRERIRQRQYGLLSRLRLRCRLRAGPIRIGGVVRLRTVSHRCHDGQRHGPGSSRHPPTRSTNPPRAPPTFHTAASIPQAYNDLQQAINDANDAPHYRDRGPRTPRSTRPLGTIFTISDAAISSSRTVRDDTIAAADVQYASDSQAANDSAAQDAAYATYLDAIAVAEGIFNSANDAALAQAEASVTTALVGHPFCVAG